MMCAQKKSSVTDQAFGGLGKSEEANILSHCSNELASGFWPMYLALAQ